MSSKIASIVAPIVVALALVGFAINPGTLVPVEPTQLGEPARAPNVPADLVTETPTPESTTTAVPTATPSATLLDPTPTRTPVAVVALNTTTSVRVPILMYHYISTPTDENDKIRVDLSVTPANFEAQMKYLTSEGYHTIKLSDLAEYLISGTRLPSKPIVLTFDDGYLDNYQNALPILKKYNQVGTFFIITGFVDEGRTGYMNWDQIEELAIEGMEIGSHTMSHLDLRNRTRAFLNTEIVSSKLTIESRIGTPVKSFCYPSGKYDARTLDVVRAADYLVAVATDSQGVIQSANYIYELRRVRVRGTYSVTDFAYWLKYFIASGK
jgi:peptidoglycan/xylan/chitin deacetylase (PgdA/CDA1 family)